MNCCNQACDQGRACPVRQACALPEAEGDSNEPLALLENVRFWLVVAICLVAFAAITSELLPTGVL